MSERRTITASTKHRRHRRRLFALGAIVLLTLTTAAAIVPSAIQDTTSAADYATVAAIDSSRQPATRTLQTDSSAEQQLADRYAPVVYLRQVDTNVCNQENEGFDPVPVDFVLGRDEIPLLVSESGRPTGVWRTVAESPLVSDLSGLEQPHFLNYPGTPVRPGCVYRQYFANRVATEDVPRVAYAHIYQEPGTDELALQYWLYYYFNDWNNNHEGDWEMIMLFFDADNVEEALAQEPIRVVYAQHGGGERADWDDDKLSKEAGHPVVYVARGAHASFYEQHVYLGLAENGTGFGCETTKGPHRRYLLDAVVVPHEPSGPDDPHAWLSFTGRWGEFRRSEWNGPTGPNDKTSWTEPVSWASRVRDTSLIVPEFEGFGESPVDLFCGIVSGGSRVLVAFTRTPTLLVGLVGVAVVLISWTVTYASGTIRQAFGYYRRHLSTFATIGVALIPTGYVVSAIQTILFHIPPVEPFLQIMARFPGIEIALILAVGSLEVAVAAIFVAPAVIWTMSQLREGRTPNVVEAYRHGIRQIWPIFRARVRAGIPIVLYGLTIVGLPWAIVRFLRTFFIPQAVIHDRDNPPAAIRDSAGAANVNLRQTALTQIVLSVVTLLTGPLIAIFLLLVIPSRPLGLINYVSSLIFALVYPLEVIGMTLLYFNLRNLRSDTQKLTTDSQQATRGTGWTEPLLEHEG